jgi:hypothetical protein
MLDSPLSRTEAKYFGFKIPKDLKGLVGIAVGYKKKIRFEWSYN